jgi:hypothetical protein
MVESTFPQYIEAEVKQEYAENLGFAVKNFNNAIENLKIFKDTIDSSCAKMNKFQEGFNRFMISAKQVGQIYLCRNFDTKTRNMFINPYWALKD